MAAEKTISFVKAVDGTLGLSDKSQLAAAKTSRALSDFDEKHQVSDKINYGVTQASAKVSDWVCKKVPVRGSCHGVCCCSGGGDRTSFAKASKN